MFRKKCSNCGRKVGRKYFFCPWCGSTLKEFKKEDYGLLGIDDNPDLFDLNGSSFEKLLTKTMRILMKELENIDDNGSPFQRREIKNIKINVSLPQIKESSIKEEKKEELEELKSKVPEEKTHLPIVEAKYKLKRLPKEIIYEIEAPGVKSKKDVAIHKIEDGIEIRIYTKDKCYVKTIPLKPKAIDFFLKKDKLIVQLKEE
ncbi:MAG: zinc ribbon domain-containing protein [Candidatus Pacearchaeota archaeon]